MCHRMGWHGMSCHGVLCPVSLLVAVSHIAQALGGTTHECPHLVDCMLRYVMLCDAM